MEQYPQGATIHLTATYRDSTQRLVDPDANTARAIITDPTATVHTVALTRSQTGQFSGNITLAQNAPTGFWDFYYRGEFSGQPQESDQSSFEVLPFVVSGGIGGGAYCLIADVEAKGTHSGKPYTPTTNPTIAQVQGYVGYRATEINSRLALVGVQVPVDPNVSPKAFALLRELNALGAAGDAQGVSYFRGNTQGPNQSSSTPFYRKEYEKKLCYYAGDGTAEEPGHPQALIDAVFPNGQQPLWPKGTGLSSHVADIYQFRNETPVEPLTEMEYGAQRYGRTFDWNE